MSVQQSDIFVRAKPRKISVTETYHYKAEVQDVVNFQFEKADGQISVQFVYDGEYRDARWKIRQFLEDLWDISKVLKRFRDLVHWFFHVWPIRWIVRLTGLAALWRLLTRLVLGQRPGDKYFGITAINDAAKEGQDCETGRVGYLALRGYKPFNFVDEWPAHQIIKLELPIAKLKQKLESSQQYTLSYKYKLKEPPAPPVRLREVKLTDAEGDEQGRLHSAYDEMLDFEIDLERDFGLAGINEEKKIPQELADRWREEAYREITKKEEEKKKGEEQQKKQQRKQDRRQQKRAQDKQQKKDESQEEDEQQKKDEGNGQIRLINANEATTDFFKKVLPTLAMDRGGYILIDWAKVKDPEQWKQKFKKYVLQAAFENGRFFVPVVEPYYYPRNSDDKVLFVIPVPMVPPQWYVDPTIRPSKTRSSNLWVSSPETKVVLKTIDLPNTLDAPRNKIEAVRLELAQILVALANSDGGSIFLRQTDSKKTDLKAIYDEWLGPAQWPCWPPLSRGLIWLKKSEEQNGWLVEMERSSPEIHSINGVVYVWENAQARPLPLHDEDGVDRIYELVKKRCKPNYPVIEPRPIIYYANLKGPRFEAREQYGARYELEGGVLKWTDETPFDINVEEATYYTSLRFLVNRPVELYGQPDLKGLVHIVLSDRVLSGLDAAYFNALGEGTRAGEITVEKKSQVRIRFDHITLRQVFQHRSFCARRELVFEGVKLDHNRLKDIQGMLADLGLDNIVTYLADVFWNQYHLEDLPVEVVMKHLGGYQIRGEKPEGLRISLAIRGEAGNISRERKEGERTDRMRLRSGYVHITIQGRVEGGFEHAQELARLLSYLQQLLKERFSHVRVQVA